VDTVQTRPVITPAKSSPSSHFLVRRRRRRRKKKIKKDNIKGKRGKKNVCKSQQRGVGGVSKGRTAAEEDEALQHSFTSDLTTTSHLRAPLLNTAFLQTLPLTPSLSLARVPSLPRFPPSSALLCFYRSVHAAPVFNRPSLQLCASDCPGYPLSFSGRPHRLSRSFLIPCEGLLLGLGLTLPILFCVCSPETAKQPGCPVLSCLVSGAWKDIRTRGGKE